LKTYLQIELKLFYATTISRAASQMWSKNISSKLQNSTPSKKYSHTRICIS